MEIEGNQDRIYEYNLHTHSIVTKNIFQNINNIFNTFQIF